MTSVNVSANKATTEASANMVGIQTVLAQANIFFLQNAHRPQLQRVYERKLMYSVQQGLNLSRELNI
jgi:hypothetical protein